MNLDTTEKRDGGEASDIPNKLECLVIDSGPIIKGGCLRLVNSAKTFWTVEEVLNEIRDSKARHYLDTLPFELRTRLPSPESLNFVTEFARKTGDLQSLSRVDLKVLALTYMLEFEANGNTHLRSEPLRKTMKVKSNTKQGHVQAAVPEHSDKATLPDKVGDQQELLSHSPVHPPPNDQEDDDVPIEVDSVGSSSGSEDDSDQSVDDEVAAVEPESEDNQDAPSEQGNGNLRPSRKIKEVMPDSSDSEDSPVTPKHRKSPSLIQSIMLQQGVEALDLAEGTPAKLKDEGFQFDDAQRDNSGQFDDAEEGGRVDDADNDLLEKYPRNTKAVTFEEQGSSINVAEDTLPAEEDFPALGGPVPTDQTAKAQPNLSWTKASEVLKTDTSGGAWAHVSKMRAKETVIEAAPQTNDFFGQGAPNNFEPPNGAAQASPSNPLMPPPPPQQDVASSAASKSKIIGFSGGAVTSFDDDGQGWINQSNIAAHRMQGGGLRVGKGKGSGAPPPLKTKAGCATTDYAMQNVLVQIGLPLLSVDGMVVRRVKQWVLRCHACFKITQEMERLFCPRCGGSTLQKVSVSIDSKTGYTRIHLRKNRKISTRGSKYNLPAPGKADRFQGELLLREDQLKMGIWRQKASRSKKNVSSAFGEDITQNFGMNIKKSPDIVVGFGRKNPNQMKGRERRGKKKR